MCRRRYPLSLAICPLTHHVRNEGPLKGAYPSSSGLYHHDPTFAYSYVESLESRLEKMEGLLQRVRRPTGPVSVMFLIPSSYAPTPTSHQN